MCLTRIYHYVLTADYVVSDTAVADKYDRDGVWVMDIATNPVEQIELLDRIQMVPQGSRKMF